MHVILSYRILSVRRIFERPCPGENLHPVVYFAFYSSAKLSTTCVRKKIEYYRQHARIRLGRLGKYFFMYFIIDYDYEN